RRDRRAAPPPRPPVPPPPPPAPRPRGGPSSWRRAGGRLGVLRRARPRRRPRPHSVGTELCLQIGDLDETTRARRALGRPHRGGPRPRPLRRRGGPRPQRARLRARPPPRDPRA